MTRNIHLLVCIHGLWGNPGNLAELARIARARCPQPTTRDAASGVAPDDAATSADIELDVLVTTSNADDNTYDGIDWGAERVAEEMQAHISAVQEDGSRRITRFSVVGYSLGGLLARYLIGILHTRGFFNTVEPCNFITISTPHIGLPRYPGVLSACFNTFSPRLLSRSGEQLSLKDNWSDSQRPLLHVMADKNNIFFQTLTRFPHVHVYANAINDVTVPYLTGAIELEDPFLSPPNLQIDIDEDYPPIIKRMTHRESVLSPRGRKVSSFFRSLKPRPLLLPIPRAFQVIIWLFLPILLPLFVGYILVRLSLKSRASRVRILGLEQYTRANGTTTLVETLRVLEKGTGAAVESMVGAAAGGGGPDGVTNGNNNGTATDTPVFTPATTPDSEALLPSPSPHSSSTPRTAPRTAPRLTPLQRTLVDALNALPQLQKHLAYIDGVLNSHAVIVCRDVRRYEMHRRGEGVLRHVVDGLVV